jgi:tRNA(Met) cytidine acetyltransferase
MHGDVWSKLKEFLLTLRSTLFRGLVVIHTHDLNKTVRKVVNVASTLSNSCMLVAPRSEVGKPESCKVYGPGSIERLLGREADYVIVSTKGLLRPNLLAALIGVPRGGGALILVVPPLESWSPGIPSGTGGWKKYLVKSLSEADVVYWFDADRNSVYLYREPSGRAPTPSRPEKKRARAPSHIVKLVATSDQLRVIEAATRLYSGKLRSLLVVGDRGRGKSFALGLVVALGVIRGFVGEVHVVAPDVCQLESFFRGLVRGLESSNINFKVEKLKGCISVVKGAWFRVIHQEPSHAEPSGLLVVDEAASIGIARLRRLSWRSGRVVAATTFHGYEGTGQAMARMAEDVLPKPLHVERMVYPIRYPIGDPLEEWGYRVFVLNPDPEPLNLPEGDLPFMVKHREVGWSDLAEDPSMLREVYKLLAQAHYRTEPDYLLVLLESTRHRIHVLSMDRGVVAVADVVKEELALPEPERLSLKLLWLSMGARTNEDLDMKVVRVVRIAVHPAIQRKGLGSHLLKLVEEEAKKLGADAITAVFARHDVLGFWLKRGYMVYYVSPRYNKYTGEKNIAVVKPLTARGSSIFEEAAKRMRTRLIYGGHVVFRDLAVEKILEILDTMPPIRQEAPESLGPARIRDELKAYIHRVVEHEQVIDLVYRLVAHAYLAFKPSELERKGIKRSCLLVCFAHIIQGKPANEASDIAGISVTDVYECVRDFVSKTLNILG